MSGKRPMSPRRLLLSQLDSAIRNDGVGLEIRKIGIWPEPEQSVIERWTVLLAIYIDALTVLRDELAATTPPDRS